MKLIVIAIYDSASNTYTNPYCFRARGEAIREIMTEVNNPKSKFHVNPQDYTLFELGEYDDSTGLMTSLPTPLSLGKAIEFLQKAAA